jgi:hypothetical protein
MTYEERMPEKAERERYHRYFDRQQKRLDQISRLSDTINTIHLELLRRLQDDLKPVDTRITDRASLLGGELTSLVREILDDRIEEGGSPDEPPPPTHP